LAPSLKFLQLWLNLKVLRLPEQSLFGAIDFDTRPSLHRFGYRRSDELAFGLDRSAAAGNGVVPMAAARAFKELKTVLQRGAK